MFDQEMSMMNIGDVGFYEGEAEFPNYWLSCKKNPKNPKVRLKDIKPRICKSAIKIKGAFFRYTFPHHLFWEHKKISSYIREQLENYIVKEAEEKLFKERI